MKTPAPRQLRRRERPLVRGLLPISDGTRQWATFAKLSPKRKSVHLKRYEEEVVARRVRELVAWKQRAVSLDELLVANPGLFNRHEVGPVMRRVGYANRYTEKAAA